MSRSKEGKEIQPGGEQSGERTSTNLNERLGARGETDYTPGRESHRDFPRKSTSLKGRGEASSRNPYGSASRGSEVDNREGFNRYRDRETHSQGARRGWGEANRELYSREPNERTTGRGSYGGSRGFNSEGYGRYASSRPQEEDRYGRHTYDDLRSGRASYEDIPEGRGRYRSNERDFNYDRAGSGYRAEREEYNDPYNRETFTGQYGDYGRDYERDYGHEERRAWRGGSSERNFLRCSDIMTKDVTCCAPTTLLRDVADKMEDDNVGSIPVVDNSRLVGIVTDRDIVCRVLAEGRDSRNATAADAMSEDLVTCTPDDSILEAIRKMGEHQVRRIPVCDMNGRLRGIIAMADIALEAERDQDLANALEQVSQPLPNRSRRV